MVGEEGHQLTGAKTPNFHFHSDRAELQSIDYFNKESSIISTFTLKLFHLEETRTPLRLRNLRKLTRFRKVRNL